MSGIDDLGGFLRLLRTELGLELSDRDAYTDLSDVEGWDSLHLLRLVSLLEEETGRRVPVRAVLEARTFQQIHALVRDDRRADERRTDLSRTRAAAP